jgi:thiosulfate reductase cytochrome b subunit
MKKIYLYPLPLRIWHWLNSAIILLLTITGIQLRISEAGIFARYSFVVMFHKYLGFLLAASFLFWLFYSLFTGGLRKHYLIRLKDLKGMALQAWFYLFALFRGGRNPFTPTPEEKFNPLQKVAYLSVMGLFTPVIVITGILFADVTYFLGFIRMMGGLRILDAIHVVTGYIFVIYFLVHLYMSTLGPSIFSHIMAMITGYEHEPGGEKGGTNIP